MITTVTEQLAAVFVAVTLAAACAGKSGYSSSSSSHWVTCQMPEDCGAVSGAVDCQGGYCVDSTGARVASDATRAGASGSDEQCPLASLRPSCDPLAAVQRAKCAIGGCHGLPFPAAGLDLASPCPEKRLVNVPATHAGILSEDGGPPPMCPTDARLIDSANPENSWLLTMLNEAQGSCGHGQNLGFAISASDVDCLKAWVLALGAESALPEGCPAALPLPGDGCEREGLLCVYPGGTNDMGSWSNAFLCASNGASLVWSLSTHTESRVCMIDPAQGRDLSIDDCAERNEEPCRVEAPQTAQEVLDSLVASVFTSCAPGLDEWGFEVEFQNGCASRVVVHDPSATDPVGAISTCVEDRLATTRYACAADLPCSAGPDSALP